LVSQCREVTPSSLIPVGAELAQPLCFFASALHSQQLGQQVDQPLGRPVVGDGPGTQDFNGLVEVFAFG